jgi:hypothetical protein
MGTYYRTFVIDFRLSQCFAIDVESSFWGGFSASLMWAVLPKYQKYMLDRHFESEYGGSMYPRNVCNTNHIQTVQNPKSRINKIYVTDIGIPNRIF